MAAREERYALARIDRRIAHEIHAVRVGPHAAAHAGGIHEGHEDEPQVRELRVQQLVPMQARDERSEEGQQDLGADTLEAVHAAEESHGRGAGRGAAHGDRDQRMLAIAVAHDADAACIDEAARGFDDAKQLLHLRQRPGHARRISRTGTSRRRHARVAPTSHSGGMICASRVDSPPSTRRLSQRGLASALDGAGAFFSASGNVTKVKRNCHVASTSWRPFEARNTAMRRWAEKPLRRSRIEIIPMIDVMMFLLVFFVLISVNVIPAMGIKTALPKSAQSEQQNHRRNVVVTLGNQGELQLEGRAVAIGQLADALHAQRKPGEDIFVIINGDQGVALQRVVDVMDAVKAAGFEALSIAARKS